MWIDTKWTRIGMLYRNIEQNMNIIYVSSWKLWFKHYLHVEYGSSISYIKKMLEVRKKLTLCLRTYPILFFSIIILNFYSKNLKIQYYLMSTR